MTSLTRPPGVAQSPQTADCRHSREAFDAGFRVINQRRDIGSDAKLVHGYLVTLLRMGRDATQTEIGDAVGLSRHQVWRAIGQLVTAELIQVIRYGLGRPNGYVLLGVPAADLEGKSGRATGSRPAGGAVAGQTGPRARGIYTTKKTKEDTGNRVPIHDPATYLSGRHAAYIRT